MTVSHDAVRWGRCVPIRNVAAPDGLYRSSSARPQVHRGVLVAAIVAGAIAVYSSSAHLAQFPHGTVVLPWQFPVSAIAGFVGCGLLLGLFVFLRPDLYWSTIVSASVLTAGMNVLRFSIFDEWLAAAIAVGGAMACALGRVPARSDRRCKGWTTLFIGLCLYFIMESLIGLWLYGNLKTIRYTITFSAVLLMGWTMIKYDLPRPKARTITLLVGLTGLAYYLLVFLHAMAFPHYVFEVELEGIGAAGGSGECVAGVVAMPAALMLIGDRDWNRQCLGWLLLFAGLILAALADARGGMICVLAAVMVAPLALRRRSSMLVWGVLASSLVAFGSLVVNNKNWVYDMVDSIVAGANIETGTVETEYYGEVVAHAKGDAGRAFYAKGGVETLMTEGPRVALIGTGLYGYFPVAGKHYQDLAQRAGIPTLVINLGSSIGGVSEPPRPPSLGVLIAETGVVGISLLLACAAFAIVSATLRQTSDRVIRVAFRENLLVASTVGLAILWTYFGEAPDTIFFYLLIMPYGLVHAWGRVDIEAAAEGRLARRARTSDAGSAQLQDLARKH